MSGEDGAFAEPWQAQAFALALALLDQGLVSPAEWAAALGRERGRPAYRRRCRTGARPDQHPRRRHETV